MSEKDSYHNNYTLSHQSDIFHQKELNRTEIPYSQKANISNNSNKI